MPRRAEEGGWKELTSIAGRSLASNGWLQSRSPLQWLNRATARPGRQGPIGRNRRAENQAALECWLATKASTTSRIFSAGGGAAWKRPRTPCPTCPPGLTARRVSVRRATIPRWRRALFAIADRNRHAEAPALFPNNERCDGSRRSVGPARDGKARQSSRSSPRSRPLRCSVISHQHNAGHEKKACM